MPKSERAMLVLLGLTLSCNSPSAEFHGHKPATIEPAKESQLNRITLTADAIRRIGIATTTVATRVVARRRVVGGEITAPPGGAATISAPVAGIVEPPAPGQVLPRPGAALKAGDVVMRFSPLVASNRDLQIEARKEITNLETRLGVATRNVERLKTLFTAGAGNQSSYERANAEAEIAATDLSAAKERQSRLAGKNALFADVSLPLRASHASVLMRQHVVPGQSVAAGSPLFEIADLSHVWVKVPIYMGDLASIDRGALATIRNLGSSVPLATARALDAPAVGLPETSSAELYYEVVAEHHGLVPGQRVMIELPLTGDGQKRPVVPTVSVLYDLHGGSWVYKQESDGVFIRQRVDVDYVDGTSAVLNLAPAEGTPIVTTGASELFGTEFGAKK